MDNVHMYKGTGGGVGDIESQGFVVEGCFPSPGDQGQPYLRRGPYGSPPDGPPGGGRGASEGGEGLLGGGDGTNPVLPLPAEVPLPPANGSLKGTTPSIFDGN
jgi:hypothetical protein